MFIDGTKSAKNHVIYCPVKRLKPCYYVMKLTESFLFLKTAFDSSKLSFLHFATIAMAPNESLFESGFIVKTHLVCGILVTRIANIKSHDRTYPIELIIVRMRMFTDSY
jgi:hypothetical protein